MPSNVRHVGDVSSDLTCCGFSCNPVKRNSCVQAAISPSARV